MNMVDELMKPVDGLLDNDKQKAAYYQEREAKQKDENAEAEASLQPRGASESGMSDINGDTDNVLAMKKMKIPSPTGSRPTNTATRMININRVPMTGTKTNMTMKRIKSSRDYIEHPESGELMHFHTLLGENWNAHIVSQHCLSLLLCLSVSLFLNCAHLTGGALLSPPIDTPPNMTITPHPYQLTAAAQADFLCRGNFHGMLLGDGMRLGKTLTAILAMWLVKDEPGFSMVLPEDLMPPVDDSDPEFL